MAHANTLFFSRRFPEVTSKLVTEDSDSELVNPYLPPVADPAAGRNSIDVRFTDEFLLAGRPTDQQLLAILKTEQTGCLLGVVLLSIGPLLIPAMGEIPPAFIAISVGLYGLAVITHVVSMLRYRVGVFKNQFPHWNAMDGGLVGSEGITLYGGDSWSLYRWESFSHAIVTTSAISIRPNLQSKCPVLIGNTMLQSELSGNPVDDWGRFIKALESQFAHARGSFDKNRTNIDPKRRAENLKVMCDRKRARSIAIEAGAIPFSGEVTTHDVERLPAGVAGLRRTMRSRLVSALLMLFATLILGGVSALAFGAFWILLSLGMLYVVAWKLSVRRKSSSRAAGRHYFLLGQATPERVVLDLGITVSSFVWSDMHLLVAGDDFIALRGTRSGQLIVARSDMFETREQWTRFLTFVS